VSLLEGDPELPLPAPVARATIAALRAGRTRYSASSGLPELKRALARKLRERNGIEVSEDQLLVTNGAKQAIYEALQALCGPGDEVLIPSPCWVTFPEAVRLAGAKPILVPMPGHALDVDRLSAAVTRRTRAVVINSPNNPTGAVYPERALRGLLRLAERRGLVVISDEAYEDLVYDGARHVSIASLTGGLRRTRRIVGWPCTLVRPSDSKPAFSKARREASLSGLMNA
jgi:aspartate aminotransferase